ncbi:12793_t:CDS:2 [Ambispora gerdemannii]|uniref:12793_t:CDS:1 n=1 Tax=Ambispora gerdemannii TaxID=144530 RepID=A0A9N9CUG3_9GLOM|nr:12793_t:CDS:2 [Ambispora gerdemannii]
METEESESTNEEISSMDNITGQKRKNSSSLNNTTRTKRRAPVRNYLESTPTGVSTYLSEPETKAESLLWWRANVIQYSTLARVAMDYLAVQATSVPSEQAFSIAKHTVSLTHNRIDPETARASLCLKSWYTELGDIINVEEQESECNIDNIDNIFGES